MGSIRVPPPVSGGVVLSYKCSAACRHCMYACSPKWNADWMSEEDLGELLNLLKGRIAPSPWGKKSIGLSHGLHFTGGEPFLNYKLLCRAVEMAAELKIPSLFVETNAFWCHDDQETMDKLRELRRLGMHGIMISVNPYYAEYVPFERTLRCAALSQEVFGRNTAVYQMEFLIRFHELGLTGRLSLEDYRRLTGGEPHYRGVEMFLMGRAARELSDVYPRRPAREFLDEPCQPPFLREWHNHFDNYGNFMPGFCGGLSLGHWRDIPRLEEEGIDLDAFPVLGCLVDDDMAGLLALASDHGFEPDPGGYVSKCHLCLEIRTHLSDAGEYEELAPREFYEQLG